MGAIRMYARSVLREKVAGTIAVALLVGIAGAAVLGALAGARRTESAYPRLLTSEHVGDVTIAPQSIDHVPVGPIRRLPQVEWAEARTGFILASRSPDGVIDFERDLGAATVFGSSRARELYHNDQVQLLEGRLPDPTRPDEGVVNEIFAKNTGLGVGDTYRAWLYRIQDVLPLVDRARALGRVPNDAELRPFMTPVDFHITGVGRTNTDLVVNENQSNDGIFATPVFVHRYRARSFLGAVSAKLRDPARDTAAFERAVRRALPGMNLDIEATADQRGTFARVVGPYADALRFFALAAALTGLFVVSQALSRLVTSDAGDFDALDALGTTRHQRAVACACRAVVAVLAGCVIAAAGALLVSPLFPIGRARDAEPVPGLRFDGPVLLLGAVVIGVVLLVPIFVTARTRVRQAARSHVGTPFASPRLVSWLAQRGAPVGAVTGVRFAVQRERHGSGTSLVTTLVGVVAAITAITAALVFATNLDDLVTSPSRYGWTWGLVIDSYSQQISPDFADRVRTDRDFTAITVGSRASIVVAGHTVPAFGFRRVKGGGALDLPAGRMPRGAHEVALGAQTLRDLGRSIGDTMVVRTAGGAPLRVKIVGRVLLPSLSVNSSFGLGEGAAFDRAAMRRVDPSAEPAFFLLDLAPGASERAVGARYSSEANTYGPRRPGDIVAYSHVRWTPLLLAGLLAVLAAGVLAHLLVTAVRARRRDLAVLKTLGFTRRQIASSVAWLATTLIGLSLLIGIPAGIVAGRWTWRSFADDLGIKDAIALPVLALVVFAALAILLANLVAALPARDAAAYAARARAEERVVGAVWILARSELRRRWRSVVALTILVGVAGGVVLALVAGARRTNSSLARFESYSQSADLEITVGDPTPAQLREFERSPGVRTVGRVYSFALLEQPTLQYFPLAAQEDRSFGTRIDRPVVVKGRLADQQSPDEVVVGESLAQQFHLGLGDRLHFDSYTPEQIRRGLLGDPLLTADGPKVSLRIVGVVRRPLDLGGRGAAGGVIVPTEAFLAKYRDQLGSFAGTILRVRTERGASDVTRVTQTARRIFGRAPEFQVLGLGIEGQGAQNAIAVTTAALQIAAGIAVLVALVGMSVALSREVSLVDVDQLTLRALGMRSSRRALAAAAVALPVALLGALIAAGVSVAASPLFPIGVARRAEVDPGIRFDPLVVFGGFLVVTLVVLAIGAASGWRTARVTRRARPELRLFGARTAGALALPPTTTIGVGFALDRGRGARAVPVRSSLIGATLGVIVLVAVALFGASLDHLVSTPSAYGTTWQYVASDTQAASTKVNCDKVQTRLTRLRGIAAVTSICTLDIAVDGHPVSGWGFTDLRGHIGPGIVRGRAPATASEVALGADTLAAIHRDIGDSVRVRGERGPFRYRVVGQTLMSRLGDPEPLADGAVFTGPGAARVDAAGSENSSWAIVVRFAPRVGTQTARARLETVARRDTPPQAASLPAEIDRVRQIDALPVALAAFVAAVALVAVGFALVTAVRRRRRDLAVLKTLGFRRRQLRATVAWHATTVAVIGLLLGIPLGLVAGRFVWRAVADELGVSTDPTWPVIAIVLLVPAAVLAVNLIAAVPARRAARTRPAVVLRSE